MNSNTSSISEFIKEAFGSNANYVEGLLSRYNSDPMSVDEAWREYFGELIAGGSVSSPQAAELEPAEPRPEQRPANLRHRAPQPSRRMRPLVRSPDRQKDRREHGIEPRRTDSYEFSIDAGKGSRRESQIDKRLLCFTRQGKGLVHAYHRLGHRPCRSRPASDECRVRLGGRSAIEARTQRRQSGYCDRYRKERRVAQPACAEHQGRRQNELR